MRSSLPSVQYATPRPDSWRGDAAPRAPFGLAVDPQQLAGRRVERDDRAARAGGRVEHAVDHQRRAFELVLGARAEVVGLEPPGDSSVLKLRRDDLIERRVVMVAQVAGVMTPLAGGRRAGWSLRRDARQERQETAPHSRSPRRR